MLTYRELSISYLYLSEKGWFTRWISDLWALHYILNLMRTTKLTQAPDQTLLNCVMVTCLTYLITNLPATSCRILRLQASVYDMIGDGVTNTIVLRPSYAKATCHCHMPWTSCQGHNATAIMPRSPSCHNNPLGPWSVDQTHPASFNLEDQIKNINLFFRDTWTHFMTVVIQYGYPE